MKSYLSILTSFVLILVISSCSDDAALVNHDQVLRDALNEASNGLGVSYYKMPKSNDFMAIPQDPNNVITKEKVALGKSLFHETAFATEGKFPITLGEYSCASCHHAGAGFQSGLAQGLGEGGQGFGHAGEGRIRNSLCDPTLCDVQPLRTPTAMNGAYQPLMLWNGQFGAGDQNEGTEAQWTPETPLATNEFGFQGLETQAIAGLKVHRIGYTPESVIANGYKEIWDAAFPNIDISERYTLTTAGLAIAAYERTILANQSPFQRYVSGNTLAMSDYQKEGAALFFGKANCATCHNGPALNDTDFHALGMGEFDPAQVTHYDVDDPSQFGRYSFTKNEADKYKFKTPQLYNLADVNFFGHGATFTNVEDIIRYKNEASPQNADVSSAYLSEEFVPLGLTDIEISKIAAFIKGALYDPNLDRYVPSDLPSGNCFPNNDRESQQDLGCR